MLKRKKSVADLFQHLNLLDPLIRTPTSQSHGRVYHPIRPRLCQRRASGHCPRVQVVRAPPGHKHRRKTWHLVPDFPFNDLYKKKYKCDQFTPNHISSNSLCLWGKNQHAMHWWYIQDQLHPQNACFLITEKNGCVFLECDSCAKDYSCHLKIHYAHFEGRYVMGLLKIGYPKFDDTDQISRFKVP